MSIVLPSSEVNQLAGATATELAGSVLSAGSSEPENPEVSGSCPWASIDVAALVSTITTLKNTVDSLVSTVGDIKSKTDKLPESPAAVGDEMTMAQETVTSLGTAVTSGVWSATTRTLTSPTTTDIAHAVWGRTPTTQEPSPTTRTLNPAISGGLTTDQATQLATIFALLANWSVDGNELTATVGTTDYTFALTKNNGDITSVSPTST